MTLTEAKQIADTVGSHHDNQKVWAAYKRLLDTEKNGGVQNSERAMRRLERRIGKLDAEIRRRGMTDLPRLSALFPFG